MASKRLAVVLVVRGDAMCLDVLRYLLNVSAYRALTERDSASTNEDISTETWGSDRSKPETHFQETLTIHRVFGVDQDAQLLRL